MTRDIFGGVSTAGVVPINLTTDLQFSGVNIGQTFAAVPDGVLGCVTAVGGVYNTAAAHNRLTFFVVNGSESVDRTLRAELLITNLDNNDWHAMRINSPVALSPGVSTSLDGLWDDRVSNGTGTIELGQSVAGRITLQPGSYSWQLTLRVDPS